MRQLVLQIHGMAKVTINVSMEHALLERIEKFAARDPLDKKSKSSIIVKCILSALPDMERRAQKRGR